MTAVSSQLSLPTLSVVIPCYNEGDNIALLFGRLLPVLNGLDVSFEVICINDGSKDDTLGRLLDVQKGEPCLRVIDLSRNFGKEKALSAGLFHSRGQAVVPMDADLQHPPEAIADMIAKWREGFEVVFARRDARTGQTLSEKLFARAFYWVFDHLSDVHLPREVGDFRLMDRKVVDTINQMPERSRFMKGIFAWVGYRHAEIVYRQGERAAGTTKFNSWKLLRFAFDGLTSFSNFPLRVWSWVGATVSSLAFLYIVFRLIRTMIWGIDVPGYESTLMSVLFLGGIQLLTLGIIGDYLGRVFDEVKGRPLFIIRQLYEPDGKG
ncbi:Glycosyl transferase family 2 [Paramagnetospirillum magnetotacticum MS-1]|uniref:Glycosyl transferase family 2 n=1 Tax=Paramagnetospirillum magnetotacticum MS-1 TaxID=272627 RepID=A0A0C2YTW6_PARME|nr:glycosyltransferase family 2 protein [Paramagnetospirillum magnetotacticum]KIL98130.1 Glycosyl transferase family 2 [Paramagnetospirillum magnetotacticum MS-1]